MAESDRLGGGPGSGPSRLDGDLQIEDEDGPPDHDVTALERDEFGFHVDDPDLEPEVDLEPDVVAETVTDVLDALAEAFNARDLESLLEVVAADGEAPGLLGGGREGLADAVEDLWHRRPTCCLTRGQANGEALGVLWEHDGAAWWALATVHVNDIDDDGMVGVLEFSDDAALLDELEAEGPDQDLEEGARWIEWEEGAD